jgi:hypothetical protein
MLCVTALCAGCDARPRRIGAIADDLRGVLPDGWTVTATDSQIRIRSEREMVFFCPLALPPFGTREEHIREFGDRKRYLLTLSFVPRLDPAELERRAAARRAFEWMFENEDRSKFDWQEAVDGIHDNRPPRCRTPDYSVFDDRPPEQYEIEIHPADAAVEVEAMLASLSRVLGTEPPSPSRD